MWTKTVLNWIIWIRTILLNWIAWNKNVDDKLCSHDNTELFEVETIICMKQI